MLKLLFLFSISFAFTNYPVDAVQLTIRPMDMSFYFVNMRDALSFDFWIANQDIPLVDPALTQNQDGTTTLCYKQQRLLFAEETTLISEFLSANNV